MDWISVGAECADANIPVVEFLFPLASFCGVLEKFFGRAVSGSSIASNGNFHGLESERSHFVQCGIEREVPIYSIENADGNFAKRSSWRRNRWRGCKFRAPCGERSASGCNRR